MSMPTDPPRQKQPYYKGGFFWYVTLQVTLTVGLLTAIVVYFVFVAIIYRGNPTAIRAQATFVAQAVQLIAFAATIALCITVARRHHTGFWRGVLLFFAGNIAATIVSLPLIAVSILGGERPSLGWVGAFFLTLVIYWLGCIILIVRRRRKEAASRVQREAIAAFE